MHPTNPALPDTAIRRRRRWLGTGVVAALVAGTLGALVPAGVSSAATDTVVESFDSVSSWMVSDGSGSLSTTAGAASNAVKLSYDLGGGDVMIARRTTPAAQSSVAFTRLAVSVKGDGSWNTLFVRLKDASGELFTYRLGTLQSTSWKSLTADLTAAPGAKERGDGDGILDAPISVVDVRVDRNSSQPAKGTVSLDSLRLSSDGWAAPKADPQRFSPSNGGVTKVSFTAGGAGDWKLLLRDLSGHVRTITGTAKAAGPVTVAWNGKADDGSIASGSIEATLTHDTSANGGLDGALVRTSNPYAAGATTRPVNVNSASFVGANGSLTTIDDAAEADHQAALLESGRVRYVREEFDWNRVEPRNGMFDWWKFDQAVNVAWARNMSVVGKLVYSADWASSAPAGTPESQLAYYPPRNLDDYVDYVQKLVTRYKGKVKVWEVWNEPNTTQYWKPAPSASAYAKMLKAADAAIKRIDPTATVLAGALSGFDVDFMESVAANGAGTAYDGLSIHTFVRGAPETSIMPTWIAAAKSFLAHKNPKASLWITEMGWSTCGDGCDGGVGETAQAQYLSRAYLMAAADGVKAVMWWGLAEYGSGASRIENYGLVQKDGRQKPAYAALRDLGKAASETASIRAMAPTNGTSSVVSSLANIPERAITATSGSNAVSSAKAIDSPSGGGLNVSYSFATAKGFTMKVDKPVSGKPKALSVLVSGDNSASSIFISFTDAKGELFEAKVGNAVGKDFSRKTFYFDGGNSNYSHSGSGVIDYPIKVKAITVYKGILGVETGKIALSNLTAHYGSIVRGDAFSGKGFTLSAAYTMNPGTLTLPVAGGAVSLGVLDGSSLSVTGGRVAVTLGPQPQFVRTDAP
ncbi:endo-1,4-beta-xylanase [Rathayibacter sp. YIM 133350]|uniref:endo-1,4-beta-xylanase n=1 Tax=Rathayibacter sp. YIM 133350 TaxID=3131992 RepID=UPI00307D4826